jgi:hypothetical protein
MKMGLKFTDFKHVSEGNKIQFTADIKADLESAQASAIQANQAQLRTEAKIERWMS